MSGRLPGSFATYSCYLLNLLVDNGVFVSRPVVRAGRKLSDQKKAHFVLVEVHDAAVAVIFFVVFVVHAVIAVAFDPLLRFHPVFLLQLANIRIPAGRRQGSFDV